MLNDFTKGFITLAFGKKYRKLAQNLLISYKRYNKDIPFGVITDKTDKFVKGFDVVVLADKKANGFFNKLYLNDYSPFRETIFIDADILVFADISVYFDCFECNNSPFAPLGKNFEISALQERVGYFDFEKTREFNLKYTYIFNGGVYYFNQRSGEVFKTARKIEESKKDYGFPFDGDEPCIALSMAINGCTCFEDNDKNDIKGMCWFPRAVDFKIDLKSGKINYRFGSTYNEDKVALVHFGTFNTVKPFYKSLAWIIKRKKGRFAMLLYKLKIVYFCNYLVYKTNVIFGNFINFIKKCFRKIKRILKGGKK